MKKIVNDVKCVGFEMKNRICEGIMLVLFIDTLSIYHNQIKKFVKIPRILIYISTFWQ